MDSNFTDMLQQLQRVQQNTATQSAEHVKASGQYTDAITALAHAIEHLAMAVEGHTSSSLSHMEPM